jgi:hypothetical protein
MIPSDTNSISWAQLMILGDRILSPRITHTKVTIEPHFVLKSGIKGSQKRIISCAQPQVMKFVSLGIIRKT